MGRLVSALPKSFFVCSFALLLAACAASETRSLVSSGDIPASKYKKVAVFIENLEDSERPAAEQIVVTTLRNAGVNAVSGPDVFKKRGKLSEQIKASIVQKEFDAVLYLTVIEKGPVDEMVPNAFFDGQMINYDFGIMAVGHNVTDMYTIGQDGRVYKPMLALKTKVDVQDTKSAKNVWTSETISSGHAKTTNMRTLFDQASKQIVAKMREDSAI